MTTDEYQRPALTPQEYAPLVQFLRGLALYELELEREADPGRDIEF